ncbi:MAG: DUF4169 family protein [Hyphomonadaceae bacterium]|nr:DUF4169 family protein [Hyphomonadaceae bacterium]
MAEIINLRQARKQRARAEAQKDAASNRAAHGRSKAERNLTDAQADKAAKDLDGHKRDED